MTEKYNSSQNYPVKHFEPEEYMYDLNEQNIARSKFITFEGGEGCGKSTQSKMLYQSLTDKGIEVLLTREVGGTKEAEKIRDVLLHSDLLSLSEVLLVMAARLEHLRKTIIPALKNGVWVICDRFVDSTAACQGMNGEISMDKIYELHNELLQAIMPDVTFLLDLHPQIALERAKIRGGNNKFEDKGLEFHNSVYEGFMKVSKKFKDRVVKIKVRDRSEDDIHADIMKKLKL